MEQPDKLYDLIDENRKPIRSLVNQRAAQIAKELRESEPTGRYDVPENEKDLRHDAFARAYSEVAQKCIRPSTTGPELSRWMMEPVRKKAYRNRCPEQEPLSFLKPPVPTGRVRSQLIGSHSIPGPKIHEPSMFEIIQQELQDLQPGQVKRLDWNTPKDAEHCSKLLSAVITALHWPKVGKESLFAARRIGKTVWVARLG